MTPIELFEEDPDTRDENLSRWRQSLALPTFHFLDDNPAERAALEDQ